MGHPGKKKKGPGKNSKKGVKKPGGKPPLGSKAAEALLAPALDLIPVTRVSKQAELREDFPGDDVLLSKHQKAAQIQLSANRLEATGWKGYRMVRATRGVMEGAWYFEIKVLQLGPTGHTRLGWCTPLGDIQAPVGYDSNSYGYRDVDGSRVHVSIREPYGEAYSEGDVIGFYISLPDGKRAAPKELDVFQWKGRSVTRDEDKEPPKPLPGSEIVFYKNGICQGSAFKDILAGYYIPSASLFTEVVPKKNQPTPLTLDIGATVRFNFGPQFESPPSEWGDRPIPLPFQQAPVAPVPSIEQKHAKEQTETEQPLSILPGLEGEQIEHQSELKISAQMPLVQ